MSIEVVFFILCVAVLFATSISILVTTLTTGSPPTPSSPSLRREIIAMIAAADAGDGVFYELGSGWGGLARAMARANPDRTVIGLERGFIPWAVAAGGNRLYGPGNLRFRRADFCRRALEDAALEDAALAVCYLSGDTLRRAAPILEQCLPTGCAVISATFAWPGRKPVVARTAGDLYNSPVYLYRIGPSAGR
jgi:hypothetical protein